MNKFKEGDILVSSSDNCIEEIEILEVGTFVDGTPTYKWCDVNDSNQHGQGSQDIMDDFYSFKLIECLYIFN